MMRAVLAVIALAGCAVEPIETTAQQDLLACNDDDCAQLDASMVATVTAMALAFADSFGGGPPMQCGAWHLSRGNTATCDVSHTNVQCVVWYRSDGTITSQGCVTL
jgi:hypothetical protein